jgi:general secretion pathway protein J
MLSRGVDALRRDIERLERVVRGRGREADFVFHGDEKSLVFVAVEPPVPSEPGPYFIVYSVAEGADGGALVRSRAPYDGTAKDIRRLRTQDDVTVLEGPYAFRFSYLERKDGQERWVPKWLPRDRLPRLIRLEIRGRGGTASPPPLVFRPRADAEIGCVRQEPGWCTMRTQGVLEPAPEAQPTAERKK